MNSVVLRLHLLTVVLVACCVAGAAGVLAANAVAAAPLVPNDRAVGDTGATLANDPNLQQAYHEVYRSAVDLMAQHAAELERGAKYHKLMRGNPSRREVALTFDDGPHPAITPQLLAVLAKYHVKATFFVIGAMADKSPELVKAEAAAGHDVGNHTYSHVNLTKLPTAEALAELRAGTEAIRKITGDSPHLFRPPGGDYNHEVLLAAEAEGYTTVLWTDDPGDYAPKPTADLEESLMKHVANGGIILLHDGLQETVDMLPSIIRTLRRKGYAFVTIDEMLANQVSDQDRNPGP